MDVRFHEETARDVDLIRRTGLVILHFRDIDPVLRRFDLLTEIVVPAMLPVEHQFHEHAAYRVGQSAML